MNDIYPARPPAISRLRYIRFGPRHWGLGWWRWLYMPFQWAARFQHGGWLCLRLEWLRRNYRGDR